MNWRSGLRLPFTCTRARPADLGPLVALGLLVVTWTGGASANGAFPDEFSVHLPAASPHRIFVGTNFGLVLSEDDGATWHYACEPYVVGAEANAILYQLAPDGAMLAASLGHLTRSADEGCTWTHGGGSVSGLNLTDFFVDPNDAKFVLAIVSGLSGSAIYPSHDGGLTFGAALYTTPSFLSTIEIAASTPGVVYATLSGPVNDGGPGGPSILRSNDDGATWSSYSLGLSEGTEARIAAVDPEDANIVYLRVLTSTTDALVITTDGGKTVSQAVVSTSGTVLSSFLRAGDGSIFVGTPGGDLYVRRAGETSFTRQSGPRLRCLGQRTGTSRIYACGDGFIDGFNLGYSDDGGQTFKPLLLFSEPQAQAQLVARVPDGPQATQTVGPAPLSGPLTCPPVPQACASHWALLQTIFALLPAPGQRDAGQPPPPNTGQSKSGCSTTGGAGVTALGLIALVLLCRRTRP
jgi:photosystem II stability/assembly factor-like uncharacterized protein